MLLKTKRVTSFLCLVVFVLSASCFARVDDDVETEGMLVIGELGLESFPFSTLGIESTGNTYCSLVRRCACPILSPYDISACEAEVDDYSEELCLTILQYDVPECLTD